MEKIALNEYLNIFYFIWDNKDETIDMVNNYLKKVKGDNWSCGRCWNEKTKSNTSDNLFISKKEGTMESNSFYRTNEYVIDFGDCFWGLSEADFEDGGFVDRWYLRQKELKIN